MAKEENKKGAPYILEFRELLDENIMLILDGKEFNMRRKKGDYTINLKGPDENIDVDSLKHYLWRHENEDFALADIQAEIKKVEKTKKDFLAFIKKYGVRALEVSKVRNIFMGAIERLRDKDFFIQRNEEYEEYKKIFNSIIAALIHVDKRPKFLIDFDPGTFAAYYNKTKLRADSFYEAAYSFCKDCGKATSYSACRERDKCRELLEHFEGKYKKESLRGLLRFNNQSKYTEEIMRKKYNMDRSRYCKVRKSVETVIKFYLDEGLLKENKIYF